MKLGHGTHTPCSPSPAQTCPGTLRILELPRNLPSPPAARPSPSPAQTCPGTLRILEHPRNLRRAVPNERKLMAAFLDREMARVSDVAERKPLRESARKVSSGAVACGQEATA